MITVITKYPNQPVTTKEIDGSLEAMQKIVGGYIELVGIEIGDNYYSLVCNEEGKLQNLEPNIILKSDFAGFGARDIVAGPVFVMKHDEEGEAISLGADDIMPIVNYLNERAF